MRKRKIALTIEIVTVCLVALMVVVVALSTIIPSFLSWKKVFEATNVKTEKPPKTVLQSIDAELVEGKVYYDNNLASVKNEDLIVTAHYLTGEEASSETLEATAYEVSVPADFAVHGGDVTVKYKQKTATVSVELVAVAVVDLELTQNPYTIAYRTGDTFSYTGMEIYAVYNDGSKKQLTAVDYSTDVTTALTEGTKSHEVTYTENGTTVKLNVPITVSDNFANGKIVSISAAGDCYAEAGTDIASVRPLVKCTYESGNSVLTDDYTVTNDSETVLFGKEYLLKVTYNGDNRRKAEIPVIVRSHVEGENTTVVGGKTNAEASYVFENGKFIPTGEKVSFAGSFANAVKNGKEASITFSVESYTDCIADITLNCGNSYITKDDGGYYWMQPLQINTILDMTVNGEPVTIGNNVVLKGCGPSENTSSYAPLYGVYYEFTFEDIQLIAGVNLVKLEFKNSTEGATTCWSESPSTMNIDWINIDTKGTVVDENATIVSIELSENYAINYGDSVSSVLSSIPVAAVMSDGTRRKIDGGSYTVEVVQGDISGGRFVNGDYTLKATLNSDPEIESTAEFSIFVVSTEVIGADIIEEGDKVYWVFVFENIGYTEEDYEFFDANVTFEADITIDGDVLTAKIDVTEFTANTAAGFNPHAKIQGSNYYNGGANANGDLRGDRLVYENGKTITVGTRTYTLKTNYSMPALYITDTAPEVSE